MVKDGRDIPNSRKERVSNILSNKRHQLFRSHTFQVAIVRYIGTDKNELVKKQMASVNRYDN